MKFKSGFNQTLSFSVCLLFDISKTYIIAQRRLAALLEGAGLSFLKISSAISFKILLRWFLRVKLENYGLYVLYKCSGSGLIFYLSEKWAKSVKNVHLKTYKKRICLPWLPKYKQWKNLKNLEELKRESESSKATCGRKVVVNLNLNDVPVPIGLYLL